MEDNNIVDLINIASAGQLDNIENLKLIVKHLKAILDNSPDEIFVTDGKGNVIYVNKVCEKHYGIKAEDLVGGNVVNHEIGKIYYPAVTPIAVKEKKAVTILQETQLGRKALVTANPVFDKNDEIVLVVSNSRDVTENITLEERLKETQALVKHYEGEIKTLRKKEIQFKKIVSHSKEMKRIIDVCQAVATVDSTIILLGESGVGKDVIAVTIHSLSNRKDVPIIKINCGAIPPALMESELFGYEGGAFTSARSSGKVGLIELANKGTLFLDEVADLPLDMQVKLLQFIQEKRFTRVGGNRPIEADIRIIAATNKNLTELVNNGDFRRDLYYRLYVIPIEIPPLRERKDDIFPLCQLFLNNLNDKYHYNKKLSSDVLDIFMQYEWPGNVRELENIIERLVVTSTQTIINEGALPQYIKDSIHKKQYDGGDLNQAIDTLKSYMVNEAYRSYSSSYKLAKKLSVSQRTASRLINKYITNKEV